MLPANGRRSSPSVGVRHRCSVLRDFLLGFSLSLVELLYAPRGHAVVSAFVNIALAVVQPHRARDARLCSCYCLLRNVVVPLWGRRYPAVDPRLSRM